MNYSISPLRFSFGPASDFLPGGSVGGGFRPHCKLVKTADTASKRGIPYWPSPSRHHRACDSGQEHKGYLSINMSIKLSLYFRPEYQINITQCSQHPVLLSNSAHTNSPDTTHQYADYQVALYIRPLKNKQKQNATPGNITPMLFIHWRCA